MAKRKYTRKVLDVSVLLKGFDGEPIKLSGDNDKKATLKDILIIYFNNAHKMGLDQIDKFSIYLAGMKVGTAEDKVELKQNEYDVIKKVCDYAKIKQGSSEVEIFNIVITQQVKELVDKAPTIEKETQD